MDVTLEYVTFLSITNVIRNQFMSVTFRSRFYGLPFSSHLNHSSLIFFNYDGSFTEELLQDKDYIGTWNLSKTTAENQDPELHNILYRSLR